MNQAVSAATAYKDDIESAETIDDLLSKSLLIPERLKSILSEGETASNSDFRYTEFYRDTQQCISTLNQISYSAANAHNYLVLEDHELDKLVQSSLVHSSTLADAQTKTMSIFQGEGIALAKLAYSHPLLAIGSYAARATNLPGKFVNWATSKISQQPEIKLNGITNNMIDYISANILNNVDGRRVLILPMSKSSLISL